MKKDGDFVPQVETAEQVFHIETAQDFIDSDGFRLLNEKFKGSKDYLEFIDEEIVKNPNYLDEQGEILFGKTVWPKEIVEGTTQKGVVVRDFYGIYDKLKFARKDTREMYYERGVNLANILDFAGENFSLEGYEEVTRRVLEESKKYESLLEEIERNIDPNIIERYAKAKRKQVRVNEAGNRELYPVERYVYKGIDAFDTLDKLEVFVELLKKLKITKELVEKLEAQNAKREENLNRKQHKRMRAEKVQYLTEKRNTRRRESMKIAANSMEDDSVKGKLASLGTLSDEQLQELVTLTKRVEILQRQFFDVDYRSKDFVKNHIQRVEQQYGIDLQLDDFPQTIQELEIFVKVSKAVNQVANDYGIYDIMEMEKQFDDDVWENDIFPTASKMTLN